MFDVRCSLFYPFPMTPRHPALPACVLWLIVLAFAPVARADVFIRWNQAGYLPERSKVLLAMADRDLSGQSWEVQRGNRTVLSGKFGPSLIGTGTHTPLSFNHEADVSALRETGEYTFVTQDAESARLRIHERPYARFIDQVLEHLRMVRSGPDVPAPRRASHLGDRRAPVWVPDGDPANGKWKPAEPARTVNVEGGWYDAGDQIKFTLNEAYTAYVLLLAHRWNPGLFKSEARASAALPGLLVEARHGLRFLARVYPDDATFVVQVADERDHNQPFRLPEDDRLDGQRPALCAFSRVHLASASAALAAGAATFRPLGSEYAAEADAWAVLSRRLYARAQQPDTIVTAFERGHVNDFYRDTSDADQLALAAAELFMLTGERAYLDDARQYAPPPSSEVSWASWHAHANAALAPHDPAALQRLQEETARYVAHARQDGQPWMIPSRLVWGSLHRWIGAAHAAQRASRLGQRDPGANALFDAMVDYTFGRNPWGVSFLFTRDLPNTVRHLYSPLYHLLDRFPTGALSEGPGNRATHERLQRYFEEGRAAHKLPWRPELARFNTAQAVFSDDAADFMTQEATIGGQADVILLLALAELPL